MLTARHAQKFNGTGVYAKQGKKQQSSSIRILATLKKNRKSVTTPFSLQTESLKAFKEIAVMFIKTEILLT